jgi:hypothetical protein
MFTSGFGKLANVLTTKARKAIKDENFALPGRRYPIENKRHAANAKARVAQHGTPEEIAAVNAAVAKKYPGMGKTAETASSKIKAIGNVGKHLKRYRKDYLMGGAAAGSLGTAYGANHKKTAGHKAKAALFGAGVLSGAAGLEYAKHKYKQHIRSKTLESLAEYERTHPGDFKDYDLKGNKIASDCSMKAPKNETKEQKKKREAAEIASLGS